MRPFVYLAAPYTSANPKIINERMRDFALHVAAIERDGRFHVLSGLFAHQIVQHTDLPTDWAYWGSLSESMLRRCSMMAVLKFPGWDQSTGVANECRIAREMGIPVSFVSDIDQLWWRSPWAPGAEFPIPPAP